MIKHQILVIFLCVAVVAWVAYTVREKKRTKRRNENGNIEDDM